MRKKSFIIIHSAMMFAGILMTHPASGDDDRMKLAAIVDGYISSREAQSEMLFSESENIRKDAIISCLKAEFCRKSKEALIDELIRNNFSPEKNRVYFFLDVRFNEVVRDGKPLITKGPWDNHGYFK